MREAFGKTIAGLRRRRGAAGPRGHPARAVVAMFRLIGKNKFTLSFDIKCTVSGFMKSEHGAKRDWRSRIESGSLAGGAERRFARPALGQCPPGAVVEQSEVAAA